MLAEIVILVIGLGILVKSSQITIDHSVKLAKVTGLSEVTVGFVFLALATSLPELLITIMSALRGEAALGIDMLFGSNIADIALVFGVMALMVTFQIRDKDRKMIDKALFLTSTIAIFSLILGETNITIGLFCVLLFYMFFRFFEEKYYIPSEEEAGLMTAQTVKHVFIILAGIAVIVISAHFVTNAAIQLSSFLNVAFMGAIILAIGSSLPELAVSITAIKKMELELAVGNLVGSLIVNLTLVFGIGAILAPFVFSFATSFIIGFLILTNLIFYAILRGSKFSMAQGFVFMILYAIFLASLFVIGV